MKKNIILRYAVFLLCLALIAGVYTFFVIPSVKKEQKEIYEKRIENEMHSYISVLIYNGKTPLLENTIITDNIADDFKEIQVPVGCERSNYVTSFEEICGMQIKYSICKGQQISFDNFQEYLKDSNGNERLKEFEIYSIVAGQALPGRYVDILLKYPNGGSAVVVPKIQIYDIKYPEEYTEDEEKMYTIVFAVEEEEHLDLINAMKEGILDVRVYLDDLQEASLKTYIPALKV